MIYTILKCVLREVLISIYSKTYMYFKDVKDIKSNVSSILMIWNFLISSDGFWFMIFFLPRNLIFVLSSLKNNTSMMCREIQTMTTSFLTVNLYI